MTVNGNNLICDCAGAEPCASRQGAGAFLDYAALVHGYCNRAAA